MLRRNRLLTTSIVMLVLGFSPNIARASSNGWGLDLGAGRAPIDKEYTNTPLATAGVYRSVSKHLSLETRASYIWPRSSGEVPRLFDSEFLPVGLGVRFFGDPHPLRQSGIFLEAMPSVVVSRWTDSRGSVTAALPGFQIGAGFQVPLVDNAGLQIGMLYMFSKDFGEPGGTNARKLGLSPVHDGLDEIVAHIGIATGL